MTQSTIQPNPLEIVKQKLAKLAEIDPQVKAAMPDESVLQASLQEGLSYAKIITTVLEGYAERTALGERAYEIKVNESGRHERDFLPEFATITYSEFHKRILALANTWRHNDQHRINVDDIVVILGFSGIDFSAIDMAAVFSQAVTVPMQTSLSGMMLQELVNDIAPTAIYATITDLVQAAKLAIEAGGIHSIVAFEYDPRVDDEREMYEAAQAEITNSGANIALTTISELIEFGRDFEFEFLPPHKDGFQRVACIMHSSGSTGTPKGVIIPEITMKYGWLSTEGAQQSKITTAFAPMNHFLGRGQVFTILAAGGHTYFTAKPDLTMLFEDIRLTRPTFLFFFPRVLELIYQSYNSEAARRMEQSQDSKSTVDTQVRNDMRKSFLGDRLVMGGFGSAPTPPEVLKFMEDCFDILMVESYGSTEAGTLVTQLDRVARPPVIDYKLRDVPELGYYTTDKPYPRGELLVKSVNQSPGFFNRPEETAALFDEAGYVITGDIMEERDADYLVMIDRRKDIMKLSNAEFVAPGKLGAIIEGGCSSIHQMYIYGNSVRSYLLAAIVPDMEFIEKKAGVNPDEKDIKVLIRDDMLDCAQRVGLRTFEVPRDFIVEMEPFSFENGLLSSVRKRMRPNLKRKYGDRLENLYLQIEQKREEDLELLKDPQSPLMVLEKVTKALELTLGVENIDAETDKNFSELGGDSLASVSFSIFIEDIFRIPLPVNAIVSPAGNPRKWAKLIESTLNNDGQHIPTFETIHGKGATTLYAKDLDIKRFFDEQTLQQFTSEPPVAESRTILLTGASGFLGHLICLEWMERVAPLGGKVICLIRANSDEAARARLDGVFSGVDADLEQYYRQLAGKHLQVFAADIGEHNLGLSDAQWEQLLIEVDHIVHPAALVNHVLGYEHLFGPNVYGTSELIRLALSTRQKRFDFVSSLAAAQRTESKNDGSGQKSDEDSPLLEVLDGSEDVYADGYGASKWANEVQLQSAHKHYGLPINIFRGNMMMAHSTYKGQINVPDMVTRLFYSLVMTGIAPKSFYELGSDGQRQAAHYDGWSGDIISGTVVGIGAQVQNEIRTFNTINYFEDDGVSLDSFVDWIESAGYPITRIKDHATWVKQFKERLEAMPEDQRKCSSVNILHSFSQPIPVVAPPPYGCEHFKNAVKELPFGSDISSLSEDYIHKYLLDMQLLGLIPEPAGGALCASK